VSRRNRNLNDRGEPRYKFVRINLDEETAMLLDRAMIAFGLENRTETALMAVRAWLAAVVEDATISQMCELAVAQVRRNEFEALREFYEKRAKEYAHVVDVQAIREQVLG
jgi:hypothetical protein